MADFQWDTEEELDTIKINEYQTRIISLCTLNGEEYISVAKTKKIKGVDKIIGGWSEKLSTIAAICELYNAKQTKE